MTETWPLRTDWWSGVLPQLGGMVESKSLGSRPGSACVFSY